MQMTNGDLATIFKGILLVLDHYGYWVYVSMKFIDNTRGRIGGAVMKYG